MRLLRGHISSPHSPLLTSSEKADNFSRARLLPGEALDDFKALSLLPHFPQEDVEDLLKQLEEEKKALVNLERELEGRTIIVDEAAWIARVEAQQRHDSSPAHAVATGLSAGGFGAAVAGSLMGGDAGRVVSGMGLGSAIAGIAARSIAGSALQRDLADIEARRHARTQFIRRQIDYDAERAKILGRAAGPIRQLQEIARRAVPLLDKVLQ